MNWKVPGWCLVMVCFVGCGDSKSRPEDEARVGRLELRQGKSLEGAPECGVSLPACETGKTCVSFELEGVFHARCLESATLCEELLECTGGTECVALESYPVQIGCAGTCEGDACDESASSSAS